MAVSAVIYYYLISNFHPITILPLLGSLLLIPLIFSYPEIAILILVAYLPFHQILSTHAVTKASIGTLSIGGAWKDLILIFAISAWFFRCLLGKGNKLKISKNCLNTPILLFTLIGISYIFLSPFIGPKTDLTISLLSFRGHFEYIFAFFLAANTIRTNKQVKRLVLVFLFSTFANLLVSWLLAHFGEGFLHAIRPGGGTFSLRGTMLAPDQVNAFGVYLSIIISFIFGLLLYNRSKIKFFGLMILLLVAIISLAFTFSRRAYLGALVGTLTVALFKRTWSVVVIIVALVLFGNFFIPHQAFTRMETIWRIGDVSRLKEWSWLLGRFLKSPVLGFGYGSTGPVSVTFNIAGGSHTHNYYLQVLVELGILGLLFYLWMIFSAIKLCISTFGRLQDNYLKGVVMGSMAGFTAMTIVGFFGTTNANILICFYTWTLIGTTAAIEQRAKNMRKNQNREYRRFKEF